MIGQGRRCRSKPRVGVDYRIELSREGSGLGATGILWTCGLTYADTCKEFRPLRLPANGHC